MTYITRVTELLCIVLICRSIGARRRLWNHLEAYPIVGRAGKDALVHPTGWIAVSPSLSPLLFFFKSLLKSIRPSGENKEQQQINNL